MIENPEQLNEYEQPEKVEFENDEVEPFEDAPIEELTKIISYNVANTIEVLKLKVDNNEINMQPEFQRAFVWDIKRASLFIDSLLIGLPIPSIFLGKSKEDENYIVIDGQQRLKSAYYFMTGEFVANDVKSIFVLKNLHGREWNGKSYAELDEKLKRRIRNAVLNTTIIEDISFRPEVVHDIFHRLNTGGMPLTDQEIRNAVYSGVFNQQLISLNLNDNWRTLLGKPFVDRRLKDVELILRFFALLRKKANYRPSMREFLSNYQRDNQRNNNFLSSNKEIFENTVDLILNELGQNAFKLFASTVNKSVCDSVMVAIAEILDSGEKPKDLKTNFERLKKEESYRVNVTYATSGEWSVGRRIDLARNYFLGVK